jgi:hypothetical protein
MSLANEKINNALEKLTKNYEEAEEEYKQNYLEIIQDFSVEYINTTAKQRAEIDSAK